MTDYYVPDRADIDIGTMEISERPAFNANVGYAAPEPGMNSTSFQASVGGMKSAA